MILGIAVLLLVVSLSGCQETSNQDNNHQTNNTTNNSTNTSNGNQTNNTTNGTPQNNITANTFLGDWEVVDLSPDYETWSFYSNLSAKNYLAQQFEGNTITTIVWFNYTIDPTTLCFSTKDETPGSPNYISMCYSYVFSENATRLLLSSNGIPIMDLRKMPVEDIFIYI
ncbi:MAG: hypothetical protein WC525_04045 [Candidatus Thermoplasmatota archaeon]